MVDATLSDIAICIAVSSVYTDFSHQMVVRSVSPTAYPTYIPLSGENSVCIDDVAMHIAMSERVASTIKLLSRHADVSLSGDDDHAVSHII